MGLFNNIGLGVILNMTDNLSGEAKKASRGLRGIERQSKRTSKRVVHNTDRMTAALSRYARGFTVGLKLTALGVGLAAPFFLFAKAFATSERKLSDIAAVLTASGVPLEKVKEQMAAIKEATRDLASTVAIPLHEIEVGAYKLVSAFGELGEESIPTAILALEPVARLAMATKGTFEDAAEVLTSAYLTFGKHMDLTPYEKILHIANVYTAVVGRFKTTTPVLNEAMKYATGIAMSMGMSLSETTTLAGMLQTKGLQGTTAGTAISAMIRGLTNSTRRLAKAAKDAGIGFDEFIDKKGLSALTDRDNPLAKMIMGGEFEDEEGYLLPFTAIIRKVEDAFGLSGEKLRLYLKDNVDLLEVFQDEGSRLFLIMLGQSAAFERMAKEVAKSTKLIEASEMVNRTLWSQLIIIGNQFNIVAQIIAESMEPEMMKLKEAAFDTAKAIGDFVKINPDATRWVVFGTLTAAAMLILAGGITLATFTYKTLVESIAIMIKQSFWLVTRLWHINAAIFALGNTVPMLYLRFGLMAFWTKVVTAATWLWNAALWANPIVWVVAAVLALVAGIILLVKYWDNVTGSILKFQSALQGVPSWLLLLVPPLLILKHWDMIWNNLKSFIGWISNTFGPIFSIIIGGIATVFNKLVNTIVTVFSGIVALLQGVPDWFLLMAPPLLILKHWDKIWIGIKSFIEWISNIFEPTFEGVMGGIATVFNKLVNTIVTGMGATLKGVPDWLLIMVPPLLILKHWDKIWSGLKSFLGWIGNTFGPIFLTVTDVIAKGFNVLVGGIVTVFTGLISSIASLITWIGSLGKNWHIVIGYVLKFQAVLQGVPNWLLLLIPPLLILKHWDIIWAGLKGFAEWVGNTFGPVFHTIVNAIAISFSTLVGIIVTVFTGLISSIASIVSGIVSIVKWFGNAIGYALKFQSVLQGVPDWLLLLAPPLLIIKYWDTIWSSLKTFVAWLGTIFGPVFHTIIDGIAIAFNALVDTLAIVFSSLTGFIVKLFDSIMQSSVFKSVMRAIDWISQAGTDILEFLGFDIDRIKMSLDMPAAQYASDAGYGPGFIGPTRSDVGSTNNSTDYSSHRNIFNIFQNPEQPSDALAHDIANILQPDGKF